MMIKINLCGVSIIINLSILRTSLGIGILNFDPLMPLSLLRALVFEGQWLIVSLFLSHLLLNLRLTNLP